MHNSFKTLHESMVKGYRWNLFRCLDWYGFCSFKSHFISVTFYIQGYISERPSLSIVNILYSLKVLSPMWLSPAPVCEQCKQRSGSSGKTKLLKLQTRCSHIWSQHTIHTRAENIICSSESAYLVLIFSCLQIFAGNTC